jgi:hypothetical protein
MQINRGITVGYLALRPLLNRNVKQSNTFFLVETPFYLQSVFVHSANWCQDWVLWLREGYSLVPFHSYEGYEPGGVWGE